MKVSIVDSSHASLRKVTYYRGKDLNIYICVEDSSDLTAEILSNVFLDVNFVCVIVSNKNIVIKNKFNEAIKKVMEKCGFSICDTHSPIHKDFSIGNFYVKYFAENSTIWVSPVELDTFFCSSKNSNVVYGKICHHNDSLLFPSHHGKALSCSYYMVCIVKNNLANDKYQLVKLPVHIPVSFNQSVYPCEIDDEYNSDDNYAPLFSISNDFNSLKNNSITTNENFSSPYTQKNISQNDFYILQPDTTLRKRYIIEKDSHIVCDLEIIEPKIRLGHNIFGILDFTRSTISSYFFHVSLSYREILNTNLIKVKSPRSRDKDEFIHLSSHQDFLDNNLVTNFLLGTNTSAPCSFESNIISIEYLLVFKIYTYPDSSNSFSLTSSNSDYWVPFTCPFSAVETTFPKIPHDIFNLVTCTIPILVFA